MASNADAIRAELIRRELAQRNPTKPFTGMQLAAGAGDVVRASALGLVNRPAASVAGVGGAINPNDTYLGARDRERSRQDTTSFGNDMRTEAGPAIAMAIESGMRMTGLPQVMEALSEGAKKYFGEETADFLGSAAMLATLKGPAALSKHPAAQAVRRVENAGFTVPPTTPTGGRSMSGSVTDRGIIGLTGRTSADDAISLSNQEVVGRYVARAAKLDEAIPSPASLTRAVDRANADYTAIKAVRAPIRLQSDPRTVSDIWRLGDRVIGSGERTDASITRLRNNLLNSRMNVAGIVDRIGELRRDSYDHRKPERTPADKRLGTAERQAADALEGGLDRFFQRAAARHGANSPAAVLYQNWVKARQQRATLHTVEDAMNPSTGEIDAKVIAEHALEKPLDPQLMIVADAYRTLGGRAFKTPIRSAPGAGTPTSASLIVAGAGMGAAAGAGLGGGVGAAIGAIIGALAPSVTRDLLRGYALRGPAVRRGQAAAGSAARGVALGTAINSSLQEVAE